MSIPPKLPLAQPLPGSEGPGYRIRTHLTEHSAILGHSSNPSSIAGKALSFLSISTPEYVEVDVRLSASPTDSSKEKVWVAVKDILTNSEGKYAEADLIKDSPETRGIKLGGFIAEHLSKKIAREMEGDFDFEPLPAASGGSGGKAVGGAGATGRARTPEKKEEARPLTNDEMLTFIHNAFPGIKNTHDLKTKGASLKFEIRAQITSMERSARSLEAQSATAKDEATAAHKRNDMAKARIYAENAVRYVNEKKGVLADIGKLQTLLAIIERLGG